MCPPCAPGRETAAAFWPVSAGHLKVGDFQPVWGKSRRSKMKQDKGRGSEHPPARTHCPAMRVGKRVCRILPAGVTGGRFVPIWLSKVGHTNAKTRMVAAFFRSTCGGHLGGLRRFWRVKNFHFRPALENDNFLITLRLWAGYPHRLLVWCVLTVEQILRR